MISIIAVVGQNYELGKDNHLLWHLPGDLKFFKEKTLGKTIIMGYNTFVSLGRLLPNRKHIVLSHQDIDLPTEVIVFHDIKSILDYISNDEEVFVIGGASVYKQFINLATKLYLTEVNGTTVADVYFPNFDKSLYQREVLAANEDNGIHYEHVLYKKR